MARQTTQELVDRLIEVVDDYASRLTVCEVLGALEFVKRSIQTDPVEDED